MQIVAERAAQILHRLRQHVRRRAGALPYYVEQIVAAQRAAGGARELQQNRRGFRRQARRIVARQQAQRVDIDDMLADAGNGVASDRMRSAAFTPGPARRSTYEADRNKCCPHEQVPQTEGVRIPAIRARPRIIGIRPAHHPGSRAGARVAGDSTIGSFTGDAPDRRAARRGETPETPSARGPHSAARASLMRSSKCAFDAPSAFGRCSLPDSRPPLASQAHLPGRTPCAFLSFR